jgi:hypothetical protein
MIKKIYCDKRLQNSLCIPWSLLTTVIVNGDSRDPSNGSTLKLRYNQAKQGISKPSIVERENGTFELTLEILLSAKKKISVKVKLKSANP